MTESQPGHLSLSPLWQQGPDPVRPQKTPQTTTPPLVKVAGSAPCTVSSPPVHARGILMLSKSPPPSWGSGPCPAGRARWGRWGRACVGPAGPAASEPGRGGALGKVPACAAAAAAAPPRHAQSCSARRICSSPAATCARACGNRRLGFGLPVPLRPRAAKGMEHPPTALHMRARATGRQCSAAPPGGGYAGRQPAHLVQSLVLALSGVPRKAGRPGPSSGCDLSSRCMRHRAHATAQVSSRHDLAHSAAVRHPPRAALPHRRQRCSLLPFRQCHERIMKIIFL